MSKEANTKEIMNGQSNRVTLSSNYGHNSYSISVNRGFLVNSKTQIIKSQAARKLPYWAKTKNSLTLAS